MEKNSVWSRVHAWLTGETHPDGVSNTTSVRATSAHSIPRDVEVQAGEKLDAQRLAGASTISMPTNGPVERERSRQHGPRSSEDRLEVCVSAIKEHLEAQVQGADVLVEALDRLASGLEGIPKAAREELGVLERMGGELAVGVGTMKRLETSMAQMPKLADGQREAIVSMNNEMVRLRETDTKIGSTLEGVQQVMTELRDGIGRSAGAMREFRTEMAERHDHLAQTFERQAERVVKLAFVAVALGCAAVVVALIGLFV